MPPARLLGLVVALCFSCTGDDVPGSCFPSDELCYDPPTGSCFPREQLCYELYEIDGSALAPEAFCTSMGSPFQAEKNCPERSLGGCLLMVPTDQGDVQRIKWLYQTEVIDPAFPTTAEQVESACVSEGGKFIP